MAEHTKIEWCDHTFNPWEGCTKVSPGCANCYAETRNRRFAGGANWGPGAPRRRTSAANWKQPLRWNDVAQWAEAHHDTEAALGKAVGSYVRPRVFCASLADWLDDEVPIEWLADLLDLIRRTPNLDWLLLTKRPQNWQLRIGAAYRASRSDEGLENWILRWLIRRQGPSNVWVGTTVEDQARADERIPKLLAIPARVRFLSCEPLLGPVVLRKQARARGEIVAATLDGRLDEYSRAVVPGIDWVICGGESGPGARPMHPAWAQSLRDQCEVAGVAFFFKQWGAWLPSEMRPDAGARYLGEWGEFADVGGMARAPHKSVRRLDGRTHDQFPEVRHACVHLDFGSRPPTASHDCS